eukprot:GHVP01021320.1.p1 GENE.GHVP01021320.1~~GHVP01021320.1.p1  ORF type:complete len:182 (+),score=26.49 GHVP01021320.1:585-1130(+)
MWRKKLFFEKIFNRFQHAIVRGLSEIIDIDRKLLRGHKKDVQRLVSLKFDCPSLGVHQSLEAYYSKSPYFFTTATTLGQFFEEAKDIKKNEEELYNLLRSISLLDGFNEALARVEATKFIFLNHSDLLCSFFDLTKPSQREYQKEIKEILYLINQVLQIFFDATRNPTQNNANRNSFICQK